MKIRKWIRPVVTAVFFIQLGVSSVYAGSARVLCVESGKAAQYNEAIGGFKQKLMSKGIELQIHTCAVEAINESLNAQYDLILAVGSKALEAASRSVKDRPIVFMMTVNPKYAGANIAGVSLDIQFEDVLKTARRILPAAKNIAVLYNPSNMKDSVERASAYARSEGMELKPVKVTKTEDVFDAIRSIIGRSDAVWMVPDTTIYNSNTTQDVLLLSLREKVPVIGLSPMYVKAGALFSLSCDYADIGGQAGEIAEQIVSGTAPSQIGTRHPRKKDISINIITAERIGVKIPPDIYKEAVNAYK